jgi:hypothetical protein
LKARALSVVRMSLSAHWTVALPVWRWRVFHFPSAARSARSCRRAIFCSL